MDRALCCDHLVVPLRALPPHHQERCFDWPHWALKALYTRCGVMFGKFWPAERQDGRNGRPVPPSPDGLLSIRSAIQSKDHRFFTAHPGMLPAFHQADDDGDPELERFLPAVLVTAIRTADTAEDATRTAKAAARHRPLRTVLRKLALHELLDPTGDLGH